MPRRAEATGRLAASGPFLSPMLSRLIRISLCIFENILLQVSAVLATFFSGFLRDRITLLHEVHRRDSRTCRAIRAG